MGEEWRRGWHPERIAPAPAGSGSVLVVGAGPAGLELARALGQRGVEVTLAEAGTRLGGRLLHEATLPGLASWMRVADHRIQAIRRMGNVTIALQSELTADDVLAFGAAHVYLATGARWRRDGLGRQHRAACVDTALPHVFTPDDVFAGAQIASPVVIYDDDHYVTGGALAERFARAGHEVHLVTPATMVSAWTEQTLEQSRIQARLIELGVHLHLAQEIAAAVPAGDGLALTLNSVYTAAAAPRTLACASLVMVTMRDPEDALHQALLAREGEWAAAGMRSVQCIGDALAPGLVAAAVFAGHRAAREFGAEPDPDAVPFERELIAIAR